MILYSRTGIIDTALSGLLTYADEPGKVAVVVGGKYYLGRFYTDAAGLMAERSGDMATAEKYRATAEDLAKMKWAKHYTGSTGRKQSEERNQWRREALEAEEAELIRRLKKSGRYEEYKREHAPKPAYTYNSTESINLGNTLLSHILPNITAAGYYLEDYAPNYPNPEYKLINKATGETDDGGICEGRNGVFSLFDLADLFGDPYSGDPIRQVKDPNTGRVLGSNPTFDPKKTKPAKRLYGKAKEPIN